jgi:glycosyltransferase involved in cell wall biosynthesis
MEIKRFLSLFKWVLAILEVLLIIPCFVISYLSRYSNRKIDVGLGPEPLISNVYHKKALIQNGYSAETFVSEVYFITDEFDINLSRWRSNLMTAVLIPFYLFLRCLFRYKSLFIHFHGGPLWTTRILDRFEPHFYRMAKIKVVVMPYGSDVQVLTRSKNLYFKHTVSIDYPNFRKYRRRVSNSVDRWTRHADWVISGCEWVDYMYHWDTLMLAHFSIDLDRWNPTKQEHGVDKTGKLRILHAPNHVAIKGTKALVDAVETLKKEGLNIELVLMRGVPNSEIQKAIESVDLVADQFVIGWYAMFAMEAMAMKKPVLCYLREDLIDLYVKAGLLRREEIPVINTNLLEIEEKIRWAFSHREELIKIGERSREFVRNHHSTERIGEVFTNILTSLGLRSL